MGQAGGRGRGDCGGAGAVKKPPKGLGLVRCQDGLFFFGGFYCDFTFMRSDWRDKGFQATFTCFLSAHHRDCAAAITEVFTRFLYGFKFVAIL